MRSLLYQVLASANIIDGIATTYEILIWGVVEANPLMAILWAIHPLGFLFVKIVVVSYFIYLLYRLSYSRTHYIAALCLLFLYLVILGWHLIGIVTLLLI